MIDKKTTDVFSDELTQLDSSVAFAITHEESQIELVLVHVRPESVLTEGTPAAVWRAVEFWTANTMYGLDANLRCIEINARDPRKGQAPRHLIGSRLVGSQRRNDEEFSVSFPYPIPGMEAVFESAPGGKFATTSNVERVILRVRMTNLKLGDGMKPDWSKITGLDHV